MAALFGDAASAALDAATVPRSGESERAILTSYLFEPPAVLADGARARSAGPDGTVDIEEHAGLESELEAAADWVARQVLDGTPLEDIAVLAPAIDPLAGLLVERLSRLPWPDGTEYRPSIINGLPGFLIVVPDGTVAQTLSFEIQHGVIHHIYAVRNPDKLKLLHA